MHHHLTKLRWLNKNTGLRVNKQNILFKNKPYSLIFKHLGPFHFHRRLAYFGFYTISLSLDLIFKAWSTLKVDGWERVCTFTSPCQILLKSTRSTLRTVSYNWVFIQGNSCFRKRGTVSAYSDGGKGASLQLIEITFFTPEALIWENSMNCS